MTTTTTTINSSQWGDHDYPPYSETGPSNTPNANSNNQNFPGPGHTLSSNIPAEPWQSAVAHAAVDGYEEILEALKSYPSVDDACAFATAIRDSKEFPDTVQDAVVKVQKDCIEELSMYSDDSESSTEDMVDIDAIAQTFNDTIDRLRTILEEREVTNQKLLKERVATDQKIQNTRRALERQYDATFKKHTKAIDEKLQKETTARKQSINAVKQKVTALEHMVSTLTHGGKQRDQPFLSRIVLKILPESPESLSFTSHGEYDKLTNGALEAFRQAVPDSHCRRTNGSKDTTDCIIISVRNYTSPKSPKSPPVVRLTLRAPSTSTKTQKTAYVKALQAVADKLNATHS